MSEWECANGHICPAKGCKCGARIVKMDGMNSRQLKKMEEDYELDRQDRQSSDQ